MYQLRTPQFPKDFFFGVADADLQVIGEQHTLDNEQSELSMWTHFAKQSGKTFGGHTPLDGIDRYNRWNEDIGLMNNLGVKHYRTSVSMCRVMTRDKKPNMKAIEWYKNYFKGLKEKGINITVTLYHWELPQYLSENGGWKNRDTVDYLVEHAKIVYEHLNEYIDEYFILNEPFQATFCSYHSGEHAPGEHNLKDAISTVHHILLAQGKVFRALKALNPALKLSTVFNPTIAYGHTSSAEDIKAAEYAFGYQTLMFTDPVYLGKYPENMVELFGDKMPKIEDGDMEIIKIGYGLETFGVNFYRGKIAKYDESSDVKYVEVKYPQGITNGLGWPVHVPPTYPEAFYDLLCELYHRYGSYGMKQIYISENGTCWADKVNAEGKVEDDFRIYYLREHLQQVLKAIHARVPVKGYYVWTLMDNFEWDLGYMPGSDFGIVHVDRKTMDRLPKKSFYWYKDLITTGRLQ